jgi:hypothetical protein
VCDLETSRIGAPYIYDISHLRVNNCKKQSPYWASDVGKDTQCLSLRKTELHNHVRRSPPLVPVLRSFCETLHLSNITKVDQIQLFSPINFKLQYIIFSPTYCYFSWQKNNIEVNKFTNRAIWSSNSPFQWTLRSSLLQSLWKWNYCALFPLSAISRCNHVRFTYQEKASVCTSYSVCGRDILGLVFFSFVLY